MEIDRRKALKIIGGVSGVAAGGFLHRSRAEAQDTDPLLRKAVFAARNTGVTGGRISNLIQINGANVYAFENMFFTETPTGSFEPLNALDIINQRNLDHRFEDGSVDVFVPKQEIPPVYQDYEQEFFKRLEYFKTPPDYVDYLTNLRKTFDPGLPTSQVRYIGPNGQRVLGALRLQSAAIQQWVLSGKFELQLIGNAAAKFEQLIPKSALLEKPTDDADIQPNLLDQFSKAFVGGDPREVGAYILEHSGLEAWRVACGESQLGLNMVNKQGSGARGYFQWMPGTAASVGVIIGNLPSEVEGFNRMVRDRRRGEFLGYSSSCPLP